MAGSGPAGVQVVHHAVPPGAGPGAERTGLRDLRGRKGEIGRCEISGGEKVK